MPKLHELLAVEGQLKGQAETTRKELRNTFDKKVHLFGEKRVTFRANTEGAADVVEEESAINTTVKNEFGWIADLWGKAIDVSFQVADGNVVAKADVLLDDGTVLMKDVPATALLELEKRAGELLDLVKAVPTLDPAKGFKLDADRGANIYRARDVVKPRMKKVFTPVVMVPATDKFPAQVKADLFEDQPVGTVLQQEWSSLITPAEKGQILERIEELRRAIKQARQRANDVDIPKPMLRKIAGRLFDYAFSGTKPVTQATT